MTQNTGSLGQASGSIVVNVAQLREAARVVEQVAAQMTRAFAMVNQQLAQMGSVNSDAAKVVVAQLRMQTAEINAQASAARSAAQVEVAATRERIATLQQEARQRQQVASAAKQQASATASTASSGTGGGGGSTLGNRPTTPAFIQFGLMPFSGLAQGFGASGLSSGLMQAGNLLGAVDAINPLLEGLSRVAGRFRDFGGILGSLATTAVNAQGTIAGTGAALATIGLVAAPFVAIIGLMSAAMSKAQEEFEKAKQSAENYLTAQSKISDLISGGATSDEVSQRMQELTTRRDNRQGLVNRTESLLTEAQQLASNPGLLNGTGLFGAVTDADRQVRERFQQVGAALEETFGTQNVDAIRAALEPYKAEIAGINAELAAGIDPANQAALAMNDLKAAMEAAQEATGQYLLAQAQFRQQVQGMTATQARDRLSANESERDDLVSTLAANWDVISEKQREAFQARISQLGMEISVIKEALPQLQFQEVLDTAKKVAELSRDFRAENARLNADRALADQREVEDYNRGRKRAIEDFNRQQAQAEADHLAKRLDLQEKFNKDRQQAESDFQERLAELIRDARIGILEAASRLDARGVFEQQRRLRNQIADLTEDQRKQREQRQEAFAEQLADLESQYQEQRRRQQEEFALRQAREADDRRLRLAREDQDRQIADYRRQVDFQNRVNQLVQQNNIIANIVQAGGNTLSFIWSSIMNNLVAQTQATYTLGTQQTTGTSGVGGRVQVTPYASGTPLIRGTVPAILHDGEGVLDAPAAQALRRALGSNFTMSQAQAFFEGGGARAGGSQLNWTGDIVLGDIGQRSDDEVIQLIGYGLKQFFGGGLARKAG